MNTLEEAINKLFEIYRMSCIASKEIYKDLEDEEIRFLFSEEFECEDEELENEESFDDSSRFLSYRREEHYTYIMDNILNYFTILKNEDYKTYSDLVSLLSIEYYNLILIDIENCEEYYPEQDNELLTYMKYTSKDRYINTIDDEDSSYLDEIIRVIIQKYKPGYTEHVEYDYLYLERFFDKKDFQNIYVKIHPNLKAELEEIKKYYAHTLLLDSVRKIEFKNLFDFIYLSLFSHTNCDKRIYYQEILAYKLNDLINSNKKLYNQIMTYMTQFLYVHLKNKKDRDVLEDEALSALEESEMHDATYFIDVDYLVDTFYNYDILKHDLLIRNMSEETKNRTKKFIKKYDE